MMISKALIAAPLPRLGPWWVGTDYHSRHEHRRAGMRSGRQWYHQDDQFSSRPNTRGPSEGF